MYWIYLELFVSKYSNFNVTTEVQTFPQFRINSKFFLVLKLFKLKKIYLYIKTWKYMYKLKDKSYWRVLSQQLSEKTKPGNNLKLQRTCYKYFLSDFLWNNFYKTQVGRSVIKIVFTSICVRNWKQTFSVDFFLHYQLQSAFMYLEREIQYLYFVSFVFFIFID